ncbi:carbohydrate kinase family protein [Anaerocellum diazotrophicum]|uniref:Fructokinase n=1 Tax=Caldicellulosiruptor diazotrophicus TaxID=2806205 RepID=A0ABM7NPV0_9FIRM|nr:carbohydrate kinase [Caldicellulosiruptor diazotrophicus]BCS82173.1 fructokinase [Caldicellulosiruptor diazotrophicus]
MKRVYTIGEILIDFVSDEINTHLKNVGTFRKTPGGAPANVAATVAKLGGESILITKIGIDPFGDYLLETLQNAGVNIDYIQKTNLANTGIVFVSLKDNGEREFFFYNRIRADLLLDKDEIDPSWFKKGDILHFCSVDLVDAPVRYAHLKAIESIKQAKGFVSFDPNVRLQLWNNKKEYKETILMFLKYADILKISEDEVEFITNIKDIQRAAQWILTTFDNLKILIITRGQNGCLAYFNSKQIEVEGYKVKAIDTTGAGDSFIGAFLYMLSKEELNITEMTESQIREYLKFSNAVAALTTMKKGAISALPSLENVNRFISFGVYE